MLTQKSGQGCTPAKAGAQQSAEQIKRKNRVQRLRRQKKVLEEKLAAAEERIKELEGKQEEERKGLR